MNIQRHHSLPEIKGDVFCRAKEYRTTPRSKIWHFCPRAPVDFIEYPVVDEYATAWSIEPASMMRACSAACGPSGLGNPDDFLVPSGMPYTVLESSNFGIVFSTPFYSVIPALISPSQRNVFCIGRLTLDKVILNAPFRHELMFRPDLQLEPPAVKPATTTGMLWQNLEYECRVLLEPGYHTRPPIVSLPSILEGVRALMLNVLAASYMHQILYLFDPKRLLMTTLEDSSGLEELFSFTINVLQESVLPQRKRWIRVMRQHFDSLDGSTTVEGYSGHLVQGLRVTVALLSMTKLDQINGQIRQRVPLLLKTVVPVERAHIEHLQAVQNLFPQHPREWIEGQLTIEELQVKLKEGLPRISTPDFSSAAQLKSWRLLSRLVVGFIWHLRSSRPAESKLPVTFELDCERIDRIKADIHLLVQDKIRRRANVMSRRSSRYKSCLPEWLERNLEPTSSVFKLVETKLMWQLVCDVYCLLVSHDVGYEPPHPSRQLPPTAEIVRLLQLHWMVARPNYEADDSITKYNL